MPRETVKKPPVSNLHVHKRDRSNLVTFLEALEEHLRSEYEFVETRALFVRAEPDINDIAAMFPRLNAANLNKAYCDACTNHLRKLEADEEAQVEKFYNACPRKALSSWRLRPDGTRPTSPRTP